MCPQNQTPSAIPEDINAQTLATHHGELMTYSIGSGPTILFVHGWSGSGSQFFNLMRYVATQGYRAVSFDHYKHGLSGGKENHYGLFIYSLKVLADFLYNIRTLSGVVSNAEGSSAALHFFKNYSIPQFLIEPSFDFYEELQTRIDNIGISPTLFNTIINTIENEFTIDFKNHDTIQDINFIKSQIDIIYYNSNNYSDRFSKILTNRNNNITLYSLENTKNKDIFELIKTKETLLKFLDKNRTTSIVTNHSAKLTSI